MLRHHRPGVTVEAPAEPPARSTTSTTSGPGERCLARAVDPEQAVWTGAAVIEGRAATNPAMLRFVAVSELAVESTPDRFGREWTDHFVSMARQGRGDSLVNDCPLVSDHQCLMTVCPGRDDPAFCRHQAELAGWRRLTTEEQTSRLTPSRPTVDPMVRDRVNACVFRGSVLPLSEQDDCGCRGKELSECRAGRGLKPGRVTLRDCLTCQGNDIS